MVRRSHIAVVFSALAIAACFPAAADSQRRALGQRSLPTLPVILELFTSQGCSSCPPADRLLARLGQEDEVIALAYHVDYWNDLGWRDPLSSPRWSRRQRQFAGELLPRRVYTPQLVIGGRAHVVGSREAAVREAIRATPRRAAVELRATARRRGLTVRGRARASGRARLEIVIFERARSTRVPRGENAGRTLREAYIVRDVIRPDASGHFRATLDASWDRPGAVVIARDPASPAIVAAARLAL